LTRTRPRLIAALVALAIPAFVAGCGGDSGSDEDPQDVIEATFNNDEQVTSGVLDFTIEASAGDQGNFSASLSGPFQGVEDDPTAVPQLDLTASLSGEGAGQSVDFEGGLTVTDDNAYVEYNGQAYEVGTDTFSQLKQQMEQQAEQSGATDSGDAAASFREGCEQAIEAQGGDASACDFDLSGWFTDLSNDGTEDVGGTSTTHVSGNVDVSQMLTDFIGLAESVPGAAGQIPQEQLDQVEQAVTDASFDVYSGEDDDLLRKLDANVSIDPSAIDSAVPVPIDSVDLSVSVELSDVNEDQTIDAPSDAKPIDDLLQQFGGLGGLGGLGALGGGDLGDLGGSDLGGGNGGGGPSADYLECVQNAGNDPQEAAKCLDEL
jgi:hypothetical protein